MMSHFLSRRLTKSPRFSAGTLSTAFSGGDLRDVRAANQEVVNRVYFALRDENWQTINGSISSLSLKRRKSYFSIKYHCTHASGPIRFAWDASIEGMKGNDESKITFFMEGVAETTFLKNRIGLCVLHPLSMIGDPLVVTHSDGSFTQGTFPRDISPYQPFKDIRSIRHILAESGEVEILFSGDRFEMEDQRNWTDGSFKTYSTPLEDPFPLEVTAGTRFTQSVSIRFLERSFANDPALSRARRIGKSNREAHASHRESGDPRVTSLSFPSASIDGEKLQRLPSLGLCCEVEPELSDQEIERITHLNLAFLRIEIAPGDGRVVAQLEGAAKICRAIRLPAEIALRLDVDADMALTRFVRHVDQIYPHVCAWTVLSEGYPTTSSEHLTIARTRLTELGRNIPIGGGSRIFFAELNRFPPPVDLLDFCTYPVTPQVHAIDERSIVETLPGQRATVESALRLFLGKPVHVGPITLKPRLNSFVQADERQLSLFAAAWTVGSIISLARGGAYFAAYYELVGENGVMKRSQGSPRDSYSPWRAEADLYPVYSVFKAFGEMAGSSLVDLASSDPSMAEAALLRTDARSRLFVANYSSTRRQIEIARLPRGGRFHALDAWSRMEARSPGRFMLEAQSVCWIDWGNSQTV
jgi:hypothetical protein